MPALLICCLRWLLLLLDEKKEEVAVVVKRMREELLVSSTWVLLLSEAVEEAAAELDGDSLTPLGRRSELRLLLTWLAFTSSMSMSASNVGCVIVVVVVSWLCSGGDAAWRSRYLSRMRWRL